MPKVIEPADLIPRFYDYNGKGMSFDQIVDSVGPGWRPLVTDLVRELFKIGWDGRVGQLKEKFGGLRFYAGDTTKAMDDLIQTAEEVSLRTCEECGKPGRTDGWGGMWIKTLCDTHGKALEAEHDGQQDP